MLVLDHEVQVQLLLKVAGMRWAVKYPDQPASATSTEPATAWWVGCLTAVVVAMRRSRSPSGLAAAPGSGWFFTTARRGKIDRRAYMATSTAV